MKKIEKKPTTAVYPLPPGLITCFDKNGKPNGMTAAWVSNICMEPPTVVVGIRDTRYTFKLIYEAACFGVNIPSEEIIKQADYFGVVSGRNRDKFTDTGLTVFKGKKVNVPLIEECPINIECKLITTTKIGSHHAFFGEVVNVLFSESMLDEKGMPDLLLGKIPAYGTGKYYSLKEVIFTYGASKKEFLKE